MVDVYSVSLFGGGSGEVGHPHSALYGLPNRYLLQPLPSGAPLLDNCQLDDSVGGWKKPPLCVRADTAQYP